MIYEPFYLYWVHKLLGMVNTYYNICIPYMYALLSYDSLTKNISTNYNA